MVGEPDPATSADALLFTVATVWREERVSCPHRDVLRAWLGGSLPNQAAEYVRFHLDESQCPFCQAVVEDLRAAETEGSAGGRRLEDLRERLLRSTIAALRESAAGGLGRRRPEASE